MAGTPMAKVDCLEDSVFQWIHFISDSLESSQLDIRLEREEVKSWIQLPLTEIWRFFSNSVTTKKHHQEIMKCLEENRVGSFSEYNSDEENKIKSEDKVIQLEEELKEIENENRRIRKEMEVLQHHIALKSLKNNQNSDNLLKQTASINLLDECIEFYRKEADFFLEKTSELFEAPSNLDNPCNSYEKSEVFFVNNSFLESEIKKMSKNLAANNFEKFNENVKDAGNNLFNDSLKQLHPFTFLKEFFDSIFENSCQMYQTDSVSNNLVQEKDETNEDANQSTKIVETKLMEILVDEYLEYLNSRKILENLDNMIDSKQENIISKLCSEIDEEKISEMKEVILNESTNTFLKACLRSAHNYQLDEQLYSTFTSAPSHNDMKDLECSKKQILETIKQLTSSVVEENSNSVKNMIDILETILRKSCQLSTRINDIQQIISPSLSCSFSSIENMKIETPSIKLREEVDEIDANENLFLRALSINPHLKYTRSNQKISGIVKSSLLNAIESHFLSELIDCYWISNLKKNNPNLETSESRFKNVYEMHRNTVNHGNSILEKNLPNCILLLSETENLRSLLSVWSERPGFFTTPWVVSKEGWDLNTWRIHRTKSKQESCDDDQENKLRNWIS